jgi:ABC-type amino acid transport substrate-binding protein
MFILLLYCILLTLIRLEICGATLQNITIGVIVDSTYIDGVVEYEVISEYFKTQSQSQSTQVNITLLKYVAFDSISGMEALCSLLRQGVHAIIGPSYSSIANTIAMYTSKMHIPMLSYSATASTLTSKFDYFARTVANDRLQATVMVDILEHFDWNRLCILYESSSYGLEGYIATYDEAKKRGMEVTYSSLIPTTGNFTDSILNAKEAHCHIFAVWCVGNMCRDIGEAAYNEGLLKPGLYEFIFSDGLYLNDNSWPREIFEGFLGSFAIAPSILHSQAMVDYNNGWTGMSTTPPLPNYAYYAYDAAVAILSAFDSLTAENKILLWPMNLTNVDGKCIPDANSSLSSSYIYDDGEMIFNYLMNVTYSGLIAGGNMTGFEKSTGEPLYSFYSISQMQGYLNPKWGNVGNKSFSGNSGVNEGELEIVPDAYLQWGLTGTTKPSDVVEIPDPLIFVFPMEALGFQEMHRSSDCFSSICMTNNMSHSCPRGCYQGYAVEVAKKMAANLNVSYEFKHLSKYHPHYRGYTSFIIDTVGYDRFELGGHIAMGDITINSFREKEICDFTQPFLRLSLGMMVNEIDARFSSTSTVDSFLAPFTNLVWINVIYVLIVNLFLYLIYETTKKYNIAKAMEFSHKKIMDEKDQDAELKLKKIGRRFSISKNMMDSTEQNSIWHSIQLVFSSLISVIEDPPFEIITVASKITIITRNMFVAGLVAIYTANLASFLTQRAQFEGLSGFAMVGSISLPKNQVCVVRGGSNEAWWNYAYGSGTCYKCETEKFLPEDCLELLRNRKVKAFVHDSIILQFTTRKDPTCGFRMLESTVYDQGFGMALKPGSLLTERMSEEILKMSESSWLTETENEFVAVSGTCPVYPGDEIGEETSSEELGQLDMDTLSSAFFAIWILQLFSLIAFLLERNGHTKSTQGIVEEELGTTRYNMVTNSSTLAPASAPTLLPAASVSAPQSQSPTRQRNKNLIGLINQKMNSPSTAVTKFTTSTSTSTVVGIFPSTSVDSFDGTA